MKDFLDSRTRETLGANREELTLRLSPDGFRSTGEFITSLEESELAIKRLRLVDDSGPTLVAAVVGSEARSKRG